MLPNVLLCCRGRLEQGLMLLEDIPKHRLYDCMLRFTEVSPGRFETLMMRNEIIIKKIYINHFGIGCYGMSKGSTI